MKLKFSLSFENYYEYNKVYSKLAIGKKLDSIFKMGGFILVAGVTAIAMYFAKVFQIPLVLYGGAAAVVIGLYMMLHSKLFFKLKLKKQVRRKFKTDDYFKGERTVEFFDDYLLDCSENDDYRINFSDDLKEIIETKNFFMIMVRGRRGIIIPKDKVQADELRELFKEITEKYYSRYRQIKE